MPSALHPVRFWTEKEENRLEVMRLEGRTLKECAERLGRPFGSVCVKVVRAKLRKVCKRREMYLAMFNRGLSNGEVAGLMKVTRRTAAGARYRLRCLGLLEPVGTAITEPFFRQHDYPTGTGYGEEE